MSENTSVTVMTDKQKEKIRSLVNGYYDIQKLRIATGNRIVQSFNIQMGQEPQTKQDDMDKEVQKMIDTLRGEYARITDAYTLGSFATSVTDENGKSKKVDIQVGTLGSINKAIKAMNENKDADIKYIRSKLDYDMISTYVSLRDTEEKTLKIISKEVESHPMWDKFFKDVKGCGPLMSAVCIAYFDVAKARHVSSFWKYAGLDVVQVMDDADAEIPTYHGEGRSRKHTEMTEYKDKDGNTKEKKGLTYNPDLKTKLLGVLGTSFLKKPGCKYEQIYRDMRARYDQRPDTKDYTDLHKHRMANRYMIKMFVRDLWVTWRELEGYEVSEPYEVAKLGMKPHGYNEAHEEAALRTKRSAV